MIRAVLTDIGGTTTSLAFIQDTLVPCATAQLEGFLRHHREQPEVARLLADARAYAGGNLNEPQLLERLRAWIAGNQRITPVKVLQGLIWESGYRRGDLEGHVYADVPEALRRWRAAGLRVYAFSSDSVHAQRLLFSHTRTGDLTPLFSGYYDTRTGGKRDSDSYRRIAADIGHPPEEILFLSNSPEELNAAAQARMPTMAILREGTVPPADLAHPVSAGFTAEALAFAPVPCA